MMNNDIEDEIKPSDLNYDTGQNFKIYFPKSNFKTFIKRYYKYIENNSNKNRTITLKS